MKYYFKLLKKLFERHHNRGAKLERMNKSYTEYSASQSEGEYKEEDGVFQKVSFFSSLMSLIFTFAVVSNAAELATSSDFISNFSEARKALTVKLISIESSITPINWNTIIQDIDSLKKIYAQIDRSTVEPSILFDAQFQLRFLNSKLKSLLLEKNNQDHLSLEIIKEVENKAQIYNEYSQNEYRSPRLSPPVEGVSGISYPIEHWAKEKDYYNYTFIDNEIYFRGLRLRSGDLVFNHTSDKPSGMFTAITEKQSVFSHTAMIVILTTKLGRLPLVMDVYERGIRLIPLHHFFGPKIINYAEVFRLKNPPRNLEFQLEQIVRKLVLEDHPYDLVGTEDRKALSCAELIPYVLELLGLNKVQLKNQIQENIYNNILKLGFFERRYMTPNDILYDHQIKYVGYVDNAPPLEEIIVGNIIIDLFREKMDQKIINTNTSNKSFMRKMTELTIDKMRDQNSFVGRTLLNMNGFKYNTFPVGDLGLLSAINELDYIFGNAMTKCIEYDGIRDNNYCYDLVHELMTHKIKEEEFFLNTWRGNSLLRNVINLELSEFNEYFE